VQSEQIGSMQLADGTRLVRVGTPLRGDLRALEVAWREADEIARIADALPGDVLQRETGP